MSAEEFWKDDPQLFVSYRTYFINKKKREAEEEDYKCWLQGLYIHDGNGKLVSSLKQLLINMFSSNKDRTKIDQYPMKPYHLIEKEKQIEKQEEEKRNRYKEYENSLMYYGTLKQQYIDKIKQKKGE